MKSKKSNLMKGKMSALLILSMFFFSITGCQKDEVIPKNADSENHSSFEKEMPANVYTMLKIDYTPGRVPGPSYFVEVKSNGQVMFIGRKNTFYIGEKTFGITEATALAIHHMYIKNRFTSQPLHPVIADVPIVKTTFSLSKDSKPVTLLDYDGFSQEKVYMLRKQAENILGIEKYVNPGGNINDLQTKMNPKEE